MLLTQDRAGNFEGRQVSRTDAGCDQFAQEFANKGGKLEGVTGANRYRHVGMTGQGVYDKIAVRRQGVKARFGQNGRAVAAGQQVLGEGSHSLGIGRVGGEGAADGRDLRPTHILRHLNARLAIHRKAVVTGVIHPYPHGESLRRKSRRVRRGKIRYLFLRYSQRQPPAEMGQRLIAPRAAGDEQVAALIPGPVGDDGNFGAAVVYGRDLFIILQYDPIRLSQA